MTVNRLYIALLLSIGLSMNMPTVMAGHHVDQDKPKAPVIYSSNNVTSVDIKYFDHAVHLLLGKKINNKDSFWYQSSVDQGESWSTPVNITQGLAINARVVRGNDARLAVQGEHLVAVWGSRIENVNHNAGPMVVMASDDGGKSWETIDSPADWNGAHGFFAMDADENTISLTWLDSRTKKGKGATQGLRYSKSIDGGLSWSTNLTLDERSCACCWNTAKYHDGQFYVFYRDKDPSDMTLGKVDSEQGWQQLSTVGNFNWDFQGCPHIGGSIAFDDEMGLIHSTVGTGHTEHSGTYYLNSTDKGQSWTEPFRLGEDTAVHSDLAVSGEGEVLATWDNITATGFRIAYSQSIDQGKNWTKTVIASDEGIRATHPRVVAMTNKFLLLWTEGKAKEASTMRMMAIPFGQ